ncbi:hypothetical protein [Aliagarivorans marinus]|uniref:hypothetical protein n=1 Tax=Aliagarivorans marinus TaxID=561965 RepID=UPI0004248255|nr:hypothetical protein [Aliagarivorans marinus]
MSGPWLTPVWRQLSSALSQQRFPQSTLLRGSEGLGIEAMAEYCAKALLCETQSGRACNRCKQCQLVDSGTHPGVFRLGVEESVKVDDIRRLNRWAQQSSSVGAAKVALLYGAGQLNEASANAFLKTLEEPNANTFFVLLNLETKQPISTVLSRCVQLTVSQPTEAQLLAWLSEQGITVPDDFALYYRVAQGSPEALKQLLEEDKAEFEKVVNAFTAIPFSAEPLVAHISKYANALDWSLQLLQFALRCKLSNQTSTALSALISHHSIASLQSCHSDLLALRQAQYQVSGLNLAQQLYPIFAQLER